MVERNCELLKRAKTKAKEKKLPVDEVKCAYDPVCNGSTCPAIEPPLPEDTGQIERFNLRLQRTEAIKANK